MHITILENERRFDTEAAQRIISQIEEKPASVVGLSTGRTTKGIHQALKETCLARRIDTSRATFVCIDEVAGVEETYSGACVTMVRNEFADALGIDRQRLLCLPTRSDDYRQACLDFTGEIKRRGGIDLLILGLGENGHIGFNQPGSPFGGTARLAEMDSQLEQRIRRETATPPSQPLGGATLGIRDIMHSRRIVLVAKGRRKAAIVRQMLLGPVAESLPASVLQLHPCCEFVFDTEAASELPESETTT